MLYKELKLKIKEQQKSLAQQIKRGKSLRKPKDRIDVTPEDKKLYYSTWGDKVFANWRIESLSWEYRHKHIVYCTFFNRTPYEMVEKFCRENPDSNKLKNIEKEWEGLLDEALRDCA